MVYITVVAPVKYHQMSLEELIYQIKTAPPIIYNETNTVTYARDELSKHFLYGFDVNVLIRMLEDFNTWAKPLRDRPRKELYSTFYEPKRSGGLRRIDAPCAELKEAQRRLKVMFENDFHRPIPMRGFQTAFYHTSAFAYIRGRCPKTCVERHAQNQSRWYGKIDFSNFFGSTTFEYTQRMLPNMFPFSEICKSEHGRDELFTAVELGFLDGVLPQGSPFSPTLTNILMVPIDHALSNTLSKYAGASRRENGQKFVYTRYCDDMQITSRYDFNIKAIERLIVDTLSSFDAPYKLNEEKTHYGSVAGRNFILGLMVNANNDITVGYKNKKRLQAMLDSFVRDTEKGVHWSRNDIQVMDGIRSYYRSIEGETIDAIVRHIGNKHGGIDISALIKRELNL